MLRALFILSSLWWCLSACAQPSSDLNTLLSEFHSMTAQFKQVVYNARQKPIQTTTGRMALSRPNQFRWEVERPNSQLLIADGHYLWVYDVDLAQATRQLLNPRNTRTPASLLMGPVSDLSNRFTVHSLNRSPGKWFELTPKTSGDLFRSVQLQFLDGRLASMRVLDSLGSVSVFSFYQVSLNPSIPPSTFQFKPPKRVEVIQTE